MIAEDPDLLLQFLDLDTVNGAETTVAEAMLRLAAGKNLTYKQAGAVKPLWTVEPELVVKQGKMLIPRVVMDLERNEAVYSVRRVTETEQSVADTAVTLIRNPVDGSYIAQNAAVSLWPSTTTTNTIEIRIAFSSETMVGGLHVCVGTTLNGNRVVALAPHNSSRVAVPLEWTVSLDGTASGDQDGRTAHFVGQAFVIWKPDCFWD